MFEYILIGCVVAAALAFSVWRIYRALTSKQPASYCGTCAHKADCKAFPEDPCD